MRVVKNMRFEQTNSGDAGPTASSSKHAQAFPLCGRYLMNFMNPNALKTKVPKRWEIFVKWCGSEDRAVEACTWGKGPLVQINSREVGKANGKYKHGDTVFVHARWLTSTRVETAGSSGSLRYFTN
jgi:hypothetical protein